MTGIRVVSKDPKSGWHFGMVKSRSGDSLMIIDLDHSTENGQVLKRAKIQEVREVKKIPLFSLVVPHGRTIKEWTIGRVIGMSNLDLSIGPVLHIRDIITGEDVRELPHLVDRLVRDPRNQLV
ncbi:MAG: hypothetical protein NTZ49_00790 [Candidatus Parcubacteria bacterium]|nr:hypothetical protein [Candidatus Parcubacteria bacterium]